MYNLDWISVRLVIRLILGAAIMGISLLTLGLLNGANYISTGILSYDVLIGTGTLLLLFSIWMLVELRLSAEYQQYKEREDAESGMDEDPPYY